MFGGWSGPFILKEPLPFLGPLDPLIESHDAVGPFMALDSWTQMATVSQ